jgi:very-short-patch-repair endonuclease
MMRHKPLRSEEAGIEARLWAYLRELNARGAHFHRRAPFRGFILDFVDHEAMLAIELLDGEPGRAPEVARRHILAEAGYTVLRVWRQDAQANFAGAMDAVEQALEDRSQK